MRNLKLFMLLLMTMSIVTLSSCSSDDDGGGGGAAGEGTIAAKIDGSTFTSMSIASQATVSTSGSSSVLILQGSDANGKGIVIQINGYDGKGTYQISDANVFITATYIDVNVSNPSATQSWSAPYANSGITGEIKIADDTDSKIIGTFNFTGKNNDDGSTKAITEGSFNLTKTNS